MNKLSMTEIEHGLRNQSVASTVSGDDEFWSDFRARARLRNQEQPARVSMIPRGWAIAAVCAAMLIAGIGILSYGRGGGLQELSSVRALDVKVDHGAVLMMTDEAHQSTILWIVDMQPDSDKGGNA